MNSTLSTINRIASWIPSKVRGVIYGLIGLFWLLEAIWNILPDNELGGKIAATITLAGMIMAVGNTDLVPDPRPPVLTDDELEAARLARADAGESTLMTIVLVLIIVLVVAFLFGWVRP